MLERHGFESGVKRASQFKNSLTAVSTNECYFILSLVCLIVEYSIQYILLNQDYNTIGKIIKMEMAWLTGWQVIW